MIKSGLMRTKKTQVALHSQALLQISANDETQMASNDSCLQLNKIPCFKR